MVMRTEGTALQTKSDMRGTRFLDGRPVHAGDQLELRLADDNWIRVDYGWAYSASPSPVVFTNLASSGCRAKIQVPPGAEFRWV
jgi:hypothetical protein